MSNDYAAHVKSQAIMGHIKKLIPEKANLFDPLIYKISYFLSNDNEVVAFTSLINAMYEAGFYKSAEAHKDALNKLGLTTVFNVEQMPDGQSLEDNGEKTPQVQP